MEATDNLLAANVLCREGVRGLSLLRLAEGSIIPEDFRGETHSTVYETSPVAIIRADALSEYLIDDVEWIMTHNDKGAAIKKLDDLLRSSSIYAQSGDDEVILVASVPIRAIRIDLKRRKSFRDIRR